MRYGALEDRSKDSETYLNLNHQFGNGQFGGLVKANSTRSFKFHGQLAPGRYVFAALMTATTNPGRTKLLVSTPFTIR